MPYISFAYGTKRSSDYWNADGGTDSFYRIDGSRRGFCGIQSDAVKSVAKNGNSCGFKLAGGCNVVLEFSARQAMEEWLVREVKPAVPWINL